MNFDAISLLNLVDMKQGPERGSLIVLRAAASARILVVPKQPWQPIMYGRSSYARLDSTSTTSHGVTGAFLPGLSSIWLAHLGLISTLCISRLAMNIIGVSQNQGCVGMQSHQSYVMACDLACMPMCIRSLLYCSTGPLSVIFSGFSGVICRTLAQPHNAWFLAFI